MDLNLGEIYNLLLAGKTLKLPFSSEEAAEGFRVRLAQYKKRQDRLLLGLGAIDEKQVFSFAVQRNLPEMGLPIVQAMMRFKDKDIATRFAVEIVDEVEDAPT